MPHNFRTHCFAILCTISGVTAQSANAGSEPFVGDISVFAFDFCPREYLPADGRTLNINDNQVLFAVLGTTYGGDGERTFKLPDLRGRIVTGMDPAHPTFIGKAQGAESITVLSDHMPAHSHNLHYSDGPIDVQSPKGAWLTTYPEGTEAYSAETDPETQSAGVASPNAVGASGDVSDNQLNMGPSIVINYCIATQGRPPF